MAAEFLLKTEPADIIVFESEKLGEEPVTVNLKLMNPTTKDIVYKVKCTSNEMFRIRPPMGILQQSKNESIRLVFNSGKTIPENRKHYFAIYYINKSEDATAASKSARELWADHTSNPDGTRRLYVEFKLIRQATDDQDAKKEGDTPKKDEKVESASPNKEDKKEEKKDEKADAAAPNKEEKKDEKVETALPKKEETKDEKAATAAPKTDDEKKNEKVEEKDEKK